MSRQPRTEEVQERRRRRDGLGPERNMKLGLPEEAKDPNFVYRWVNNRPGRVRQLTTQDDYDVVSMSEGDPVPEKSTAEGTVVTRTVDSGQGEQAVLLRKPKKFYDADKAEEQKVLDARDETMRRGIPASQNGLQPAEAYVPNNRNIIGGR